MTRKYIVFQPAILFICCLLSLNTGMAAPKLSSYGIDSKAISVSGISSGAYMALQFHVAHSATVMGAGIIAGGPYYCSKGSTWTLNRCVRLNGVFTGPPAVADSLEKTNEEAARGRIDAPRNMSASRVWLFTGGKDTVVPSSVMDTVGEYYKKYLTPENIHMEVNPQAAHAMISPYAEHACGYEGTPFLNHCSRYSAAGALMQWIYREKFITSAVADPRHLSEFDQTEFFDSSDPGVSMHAVGHIYVPETCARAGSRCRLHIVFHGCLQYQDLIGDAFYTRAGYNEWAEANRMIILYPQTKSWNVRDTFWSCWYPGTCNPNGCWDWWGYSGRNYHVRQGKQIQAVRRMIDRLKENGAIPGHP